jgi:hypothetical protein
MNIKRRLVRVRKGEWNKIGISLSINAEDGMFSTPPHG